jgi:hypothetical protein
MTASSSPTIARKGGNVADIAQAIPTEAPASGLHPQRRVMGNAIGGSLPLATGSRSPQTPNRISGGRRSTGRKSGGYGWRGFLP